MNQVGTSWYLPEGKGLCALLSMIPAEPTRRQSMYNTGDIIAWGLQLTVAETLTR